MELESLRCSHRWSGLGGPDIKSALLGKQSRYAPDRSFDTLHIRLELRVDFSRRRVEGLCATRVRAIVGGLKSLSFDAASMRILGVSFEGAKARFEHRKNRLKVVLPRSLRAGEEAEVDVRYRLERPTMGLHFVSGRGRGAVQLWSQGQPEDSKFWFPCHDAPHEKATSEILATVPDGFVVVSNGILIERRTDARRRLSVYHWRMDQPHSVYLISLAAGRFGVVEDRWEHVPLTVYCAKGREEDARRGLGKTAKAMEFFSTSIGTPYPYEKYAQVCVGEFPGGMENTTATTMTEACLIDRRAALDTDVDMLMSHELAHQWFGDLLTCRDWSHGWLNEGFATYFETLFTLHDKGRDEFDYELYRNALTYFQEDRDRYRRPVVCKTFKNPWVLFDRHLYEKAGWVLHMLKGALGDELWWRAIGHYVRKHRDQSVVTEDLITAIEEATGRNMRAFFDQWIYRSGYPVFNVRHDWNRGSSTATLWVLQSQGSADENSVFHVDVQFRFEGRGWVRTFTRRIDQKEQRWDFRLPGPPLSAEFDPEHRILKKADFKKPLTMWLYQLRRASRAMGRIEAAHEVARWGGAGGVEALAGALRREKFWGASAEMASSIASIGTPAAFAALKGLLGHPHPKVRRAVVESLAAFKTPETARLLSSAARRDPSIHVEAAAARALGRFQDPRYAGVIRRKLSQPSYSDTLRIGAIGGLAALRDRRFLPELRRESLPGRTFPGRAHAIRALAAFSSALPDVIFWIGDYVYDSDERIANATIHALAMTEDPRALPILERFRDRSRSMRLRTSAEEALARIKSGFSLMGQR